MRFSPASAALLLASLSSAACRQEVPPEPTPPPNILVLLVDCLRGDRFAAPHPYRRALTPNLDILVEEGIRFTSAFSQAPWTRPSVPTILTGLYPSEHQLAGFVAGEGEHSGARLSEAAVTIAEGLGAVGYATALVGEQGQLAPKFGLNQGFDFYNHKSAKASRINKRFLEWLESEPRRPFFAYLHYLELHWPYCPPEGVKGTFTADYEGRSFCHQWRKLRTDLRSGAVVLSAEELEAMEARYDEEILGFDRSMGGLIASLRERGLWDDTLIVLTSDHGEEFFEHGHMGHGGSLHDELISVPLVFKPPVGWGTAPGSEQSSLAELRDLVPTLLEAAGAELDESAARRSLLPWIRGGQRPEARPYVVSEHTSSVAVRTDRYKLITHLEGTATELYDLVQDPAEKKNIAASEGEQVARMQALLAEWHANLRPVAPAQEVLDQDTVEDLKELGYID